MSINIFNYLERSPKDYYYFLVSMCKPYGTWNSCIRYEKFLTQYNNILQQGGILYLAERQHNYSYLIVDIDISSKHSVPTELHTDNDIKQVYDSYVSVLKDKVSNWKKEYEVCVVLEKPPYVSKENKHGFHLHFINFVMSRDNRTIIREQAQELRKNKFPADDIETKFWLMYGSVKSEDAKPYLVTKILNDTGFHNPKPSVNWPLKLTMAYPVKEQFNLTIPDTLDFISVFKPPKTTKTYISSTEDIDTDLNDEDEKTVLDFLEQREQGSNFVLKGARLNRICESECLVNPACTHEKDNSYVLKNSTGIYIGCYRGCQKPSSRGKLIKLYTVVN